MSRLPILYQWRDEIKHNLPSLSLPQATVLAIWSLGIWLGGTASLSNAVLHVHRRIGQPYNTVNQRAREWYKDASHKCGRHRATLCVEDCFACLLTWILSAWKGELILLALDATTIGDRFTLLCVSVLFRGMAIPVAWHVLPGNKKEAWQPHWGALLDRLKGADRNGRTVLALADRGLYSKWLFKKIAAMGWHPFLRIQLGGFFTPEGAPMRPLESFVGPCGHAVGVCGIAFKRDERRLPCTLLTWCQKGMEPLLVLTDLRPDVCDPLWYKARFWIEREFKTRKSAAMQLQRTRMTDPARLSRIILAISVSILRAISEGSRFEDDGEGEQLYNIAINQRRRSSGTLGRRLSLYSVGRSIIAEIVMAGKRLRPIGLRPEPMVGLAVLADTS